MEKDDELKGSGNSYDFGARIYDPRIGRWLTIDPQSSKQPSFSPYKAFFNSPIIFNDPDGEHEYLTVIYKDSKGNVTSKVVSSEAISDKVRAGNIKTDRDGNQYRNFYDFRTVVTITTGADGKTTTEITYYTLTKFKVAKAYIKGLEFRMIKVKVGDMIDGDLVRRAAPHDYTQRGGINLTSKDGGADPTKQKSKYNVESTDIGDILTYTGAGARALKKVSSDWLKNGKEWADLVDKGKGVAEESDSRSTPETEPLKDSVIVLEKSYGKTDGYISSKQSKKDAQSYEGKRSKGGDTIWVGQ